MKTKPLHLASGLLTFLAGCATPAVQASRAPIKEDAHFTIAHLDLSQVDVSPKPLKMVPPRIPITPSGNGPDGYAIMEFIVDAGGRPREVQWVEASDAQIAGLATTAIAASRFLPAQKGGKAVATLLKVRWELGLNKASAIFFPPNYSSAGAVPVTGPTNYTEQGVNPKTPAYFPGGPLP
jgi:Gram-negative bacterial TonB protein C-terminal